MFEKARLIDINKVVVTKGRIALKYGWLKKLLAWNRYVLKLPDLVFILCQNEPMPYYQQKEDTRFNTVLLSTCSWFSFFFSSCMHMLRERHIVALLCVDAYSYLTPAKCRLLSAAKLIQSYFLSNFVFANGNSRAFIENEKSLSDRWRGCTIAPCTMHDPWELPSNNIRHKNDPADA